MTKLIFSLYPCTAELELSDFPIKKWTDLAASAHLDSGGGHIDDSKHGKLICHSEGQPVVTLEATWKVKMPETGTLIGRANCDLCSDTTTEQKWTLISRDD
jgi:hypothetical protein